MTAALQSETKSTSRRALLAGALGGIGALAATAIGRADPVRANDPNDVVLGSSSNVATTTTKISNLTSTDTVLEAESSSGIAVSGTSSTNIGVKGTSTSSVAVYGVSDTNLALWGHSAATNWAACAARSVGHSTGVQGFSGEGSLPAAKADTGVFGYANANTTATGVRGESAIGVGVRGKATTGYAGFFDGRVFTTRYYELAEITTPNAPAANQARLFLRDSGGKTQLCVRFSSGAVQLIASQP